MEVSGDIYITQINLESRYLDFEAHCTWSFSAIGLVLISRMEFW